MTNYRLSEEELKAVLVKTTRDEGYQKIVEIGYRLAEENLVPLLEEKDRLLIQCKDHITASFPENKIMEKSRKELLIKLQSIK